MGSGEVGSARAPDTRAYILDPLPLFQGLVDTLP